MNRCLVGSGVGSSGKGVCALSSSLLANFLPSDETDANTFLTSGSSGAEGNFNFSQTHAQLL
jgi:hypothetical protein